MIDGHSFFESDSDLGKTSFSVFVTILYIKVLYILVMILFREPLQQPWILTYKGKHISINKDVAAKLQSSDIIAINFLYQSYCNKFEGCVLNEEEGFTTQLQVSVFLNFLKQALPVKKSVYILVITPGYLIEKWHNKLENIGGYNVKIVDSTTCSADFDQENYVALLLSFENIKLVEILSQHYLNSVIIDHFDIVANKLIVEKIGGEFNIGITRRNFYTNPDQKLQWKMLKWTNPMCVGRLKDYYEADNDNFANLRDNYHHWWFTLTWDYCDSFKRNSDSEESQPPQSIKTTKRIYKRRKRKDCSYLPEVPEEKPASNTKDEENAVKFNIINDNHTKTSDEDSDKIRTENDSSDSQETIEYVPKNVPEDVSDLDNFKTEILGDSEILMGIIEGTSTQTSFEKLDHETKVNLKKEELYSQIFGDNVLSNTNTDNSSEDYLRSLI